MNFIKLAKATSTEISTSETVGKGQLTSMKMEPSWLVPACFKKPKATDHLGCVVPLATRWHTAQATSRLGSEHGVPRRTSSLTSTQSSDAVKRLNEVIDQAVFATGKDGNAASRRVVCLQLAINDVGFGRYQWFLFALCGCGWGADNLWLNGLALCLPQMAVSLGVNDSVVKYATLGLTTGLCLGAGFWGTVSDKWGRRLAFNTTLIIVSAAGFAAAAVGYEAESTGALVGISILLGALGFGLGGNLVVDGTLLLEFLPASRKYMLTLLAGAWSLGTVIAAALAWGIIPNFSCNAGLTLCRNAVTGEQCCHAKDNMGWLYLLLAMSGITVVSWLARFFAFSALESPSYLLAKGRIAEATAVVRTLAHRNGTTTWLTESILSDVGCEHAGEKTPGSSKSKAWIQNFKHLFEIKKLGVNTSLLFAIWTLIGLSFPLYNAFLPQYLSNSEGAVPTSPSTSTMNYFIASCCGVPGCLLAAWLVTFRWLGRRYTMAGAAALTGVFVVVFTVSPEPSHQLAFSCLQAFFQNIMYGVLYAYTPETFPAACRGTGVGTASFLGRLSGIAAPLVAIYSSMGNPKAPIWVSGGGFIAAALLGAFLRIETNGTSTRKVEDEESGQGRTR